MGRRYNTQHLHKNIIAGSSTTSLYDSREWNADGDKDTYNGSSNEPRIAYLLPFPSSEALVLGESISLTFKDGRHIELIDTVISPSVNNTLGMLLMDDDGIFLPYMPLIKVTSWEVKSGFRGRVHMDVTLQCVGVLQLIELDSMKPYCRGKCVEVKEIVPPMLDKKEEDEDDGLMVLARQLAFEIQSMLFRNSANNNATEIPSSSTITSKESSTSLSILQQRYTKTYQTLLQHISNAFIDDEDIDEYYKLTAIGWAALSCLTDRSQLYHTNTVINHRPSSTKEGETTREKRSKRVQETIAAKIDESNTARDYKKYFYNNLVQRLKLGRNIILEKVTLDEERNLDVSSLLDDPANKDVSTFE